MLEFQKSSMLSLSNDVSWATVIAGRVFVPSSVMYSFHFVAMFNIVAYPQLKQSMIRLNNMSWPVKDINNYQTYVQPMMSFWMTMHVFVEQLSLFLV